jgi:Pyruvate/2-oxoacid:ferredoxin oxidoreductase delta subunit
MKVTLLTFSITGNTKLAAKRIAAKLTESGKHTVQHVALVKLGKEVDSLGLTGPLLASTRTTIEASDVVAIGCFSNTNHPSYRVDQLFGESVLPASLFANMKYFFVFGTAGQTMGRTLTVTSTILIEKNPSAAYLGELTILAPENWPPLLPERPYRDTWRPSELTHADEFGAQIAKYLNGDEPIPKLTVEKGYTWTVITKKGRFRKWFVPKPVCDHSKCLRCGKCAKKCPYNAVTLSPDIEDGFPVFDLVKCEGCSRCFHKCPAEAIEMPNSKTKTRSRYPNANTVLAGQKCADGMIAQPFPGLFPLNARNLIGRGRETCAVVLVIVLLIAIVIGVRLRRN